MTEPTEERPHVLVVEDEPELASLYAAWLADGYEVTTTNDGAAALEAFGPDVDVVLLDRRMPGMPGDDVLSVLRDTDATARVAMVTAVEPSEDVVELGFDDYLCKPVRRDAVLNTVARLVRRAEYDAEAQRHFALARKIALLETHLAPHELSESEAYTELKAEFEAVDTDLSARLDDCSPADLRAVIAGR